jgi:hypothetical protein
MHVDGGLAAPFFVPLPGVKAPQDAARPPPEVQISLILNRQLDARIQSVAQRTMQIVLRSISFRNRQFNRGALEALDEQALTLGFGLQVTDIPLRYPLQPLDFSASKLHDLFAYGRRCARADRVWLHGQDALAHESGGARTPIQVEDSQIVDCPAQIGLSGGAE